jgi:hypothetical protein
MMKELSKRGLADRTYLWSDDNLSTDYFWRYLSSEDISLVRSYKNYGKVCCFKGFSPDSFQFNTRANASLFDQQFSLFSKYAQLGIDLYGYATFTTLEEDGIANYIAQFCDRLQKISVNLPLRVIPLEVRAFTPTKSRMQPIHERALKLQWIAIECWIGELRRRFAPEMSRLPIHAIPM